ncbi:DNA phosphorothioation system restriction enzyme [Pannus brasiliensis CCIBt3594]|uniref:DNA phosphorothioation system restriction enzyme n=1 Tax=Pannus brasiliensis CCIBt3594 TaxID=1427578 RepID=A0AAW9QJH3_9CHRO
MDRVLDIDWERLARDFQKSARGKKVAEARGIYRLPPDGKPRIPADLELRDYQNTAIVGWFRARGRGTLKMATGSGKTIAALAITTELYEAIDLQAVIVLCPYRHLVNQWGRECEKFNLQPILAFENVRSWQNELSTGLYNLRSGRQAFLTVLTTNSTFITEGFQSQIQFFPEKTLIIGDEVHNLGSPRLEELLPRGIGLRLGLSATPERYFDEEGTDAILDYFGRVLQPEFTLADAIAKGALVNYLYYPIFVELTEAEALTYAKLTQRIGWALGKNDGFLGSETVTSLLMRRARLVGSATNKLSALRELMRDRLDTARTLFYCGDGYVEGETSRYRRQVNAVTHLLGTELGYRVTAYTADTPLEERERIREQFDRGVLQGIVAIRCLDEGVDIPSIETAVILASSGNPRQFIQRRGRILRPHPGKDKATLFDSIVIPPKLDRETWEVERNLLRKELRRFLEFAGLALNASEATGRLLEIQEGFGI